MRSELGNERNIMKAIGRLCEKYSSRPQYPANLGKDPFWFLQMFENIVREDHIESVVSPRNILPAADLGAIEVLVCEDALDSVKTTDMPAHPANAHLADQPGSGSQIKHDGIE